MEAQNPASRFRLDASKNTYVKKRSVSITNRFGEDMVTSCTIEVPSIASSRGYKARGPVRWAHLQTLSQQLIKRRPGNGWDYLSSINSMLNPKWNEAQKYICNPRSGHIPVECLSTKTYNGRAVPISGRMTKSGPLHPTSGRLTKSGPLLPPETRLTKIRNNVISFEAEDVCKIPYAEEMPMRRHCLSTKDVGIQSSLPEQISDRSNGSPDLSSTFKGSSFTSCSSGGSSSLNNTEKLKNFTDVEQRQKENQTCLKRKKKLIQKWKSWTCLTMGLVLLRPQKKTSG